MSLPIEDELVAILKADSRKAGGRARRGYSDRAARIVAQRVLIHVALTGAASDYRLNTDDLTGLCQGEYQQGQPVGFFGLSAIATWLAQAFISWAVQRLLKHIAERRE